MASEGTRRGQVGLDGSTRYFGPTDLGNALGQVVIPAGAGSTYSGVMDLAGTARVGFLITIPAMGANNVRVNLLQVDPQTQVIQPLANVAPALALLAAFTGPFTINYAVAPGALAAPFLCVLEFFQDVAVAPGCTLTDPRLWASP